MIELVHNEDWDAPADTWQAGAPVSLKGVWPKGYGGGRGWWIDRMAEAVWDETVFCFRGVADAEARREEALRILADIYDTAAAAWNDMLHDEENGEPDGTPRYEGAQIFDEQPMVATCWIGSFAEAFRRVARRADAKPADRRFAYFALGVLYCGWREHIRRLHHTPSSPQP